MNNYSLNDDVQLFVGSFEFVRLKVIEDDWAKYTLAAYHVVIIPSMLTWLHFKKYYTIFRFFLHF